MKKKFLAMYALAGALVASPVFTSCIDDTESASVTAVRNAKAAQIKATADYEAKMNEVNLALKQLELETNQMALDGKKVEFDKVKAETEAAIAEAKYNTAFYTQKMYGAQDDIMTELTENYTTALNNIVTTKESIIKKNADIVTLENGIVSLQEYVAEQTGTLNEKIAAAEAKIELWKDAEGGVNKEEINAEIDALKAEMEKLQAEQTALSVEYGPFNYEYDGYTPYWDDPSSEANGDEPTGYNATYFTKEAKLTTIIAARKLKELAEELNNNSSYNTEGNEDDGTWSFLMEDAEGYLILKEAAVTKYKQLGLATDGKEELEEAKVDLAEMEVALGTEADKADTKYQDTETTLALTKYAELAAAKATLETAEKAYTEKKTAYETALAAYNAKKTAENEAQAAVDAAQAAVDNNEDETKAEALTAALTAAQTALETAQEATATAEEAKNEAYEAYQPTEQLYKDAIENVEKAELAIAKAIDEINSKKEWIAHYYGDGAKKDAEFEAWIAAFSGDDYAAYKAAKDALAAKQKEINDINTEKSALQELLDCTDVEALIAVQEEYIEGWKKDLADLENATKGMTLPSINGSSWKDYSEADIEAVIALVKEQIANLEIKLELEEKRAEQAKAALDAYLGTEEA